LPALQRLLSRKSRLLVILALAVSLALWVPRPLPAQAVPAAAPKAYLPLILGPAGPANGDFEQGRAVWSESSTHAWKLIFPAGDLNIAPHGGNWAAWLGGVLSETSAVQQTLRVSEASPYLSYWRWIAAEETNCAANLGRVMVNEVVVEQFGLCAGNGTHGWARRVLDLKAYAGKTVTLKFSATIGSAKTGNLYLDDIAFQSSP